MQAEARADDLACRVPRRSALATGHRRSSRGLGAGCTVGPTSDPLSCPPRSAPAGSKGAVPPSTKPLKMATAPGPTSLVPAPPPAQAQKSERRQGRGRALSASHARARARPPLLSSRSPRPAGRRAQPAGILVPPTRSSRPAPPFARSATLCPSHLPSRWWRSSPGDSLSATAGPFVSASLSCALPPARLLARSLIRALGRLHASPLVYLARTVAPPSASPRRCSTRSHPAVARPRQQPSGGSGDDDDSDVAQSAGFLRRSAGPA